MPPIYGAEYACVKLQNAGIHDGDLELELGNKLLISFCDTLKSLALSLSYLLDGFMSQSEIRGISPDGTFPTKLSYISTRFMMLSAIGRDRYAMI